MPREQFHQSLQDLRDELLLLASMASTAVKQSLEAMINMDEALAHTIIAEDSEINRKRFMIEDTCLTLIATQQPMASDMRLLAAVLEISGELERIADYGKGISRIVIYMAGQPPIKPLVDLPLMAEIACAMLDKAMDAFINGDADLARDVPKMDNKVDALYNKVYRDLLTLLIAHPDDMQRANYLLWAAHNLERFGDRVINICERVVYMVTGEFNEVDTLEFRVAANQPKQESMTS